VVGFADRIFGRPQAELGGILAEAFRSVPSVAFAPPDETLLVSIKDAPALSLALCQLARALSTERPAARTFVCANFHSTRPTLPVWVKIVHGPYEEGDQGGEKIKRAVEALGRSVTSSKGKLVGGGCFVTLCFDGRPAEGRGGRELFPAVEKLDWEARYEKLLERAAFESLRDTAFRFSLWAERVLHFAKAHDRRTVLCPSVGLNVDPWIFAAGGLRCIAFDRSARAIRALARPDRLADVYSRESIRRWDIVETTTYSGGVNPDRFGDLLPDLGSADVIAELARRAAFMRSDWASVPLPSRSVDVVFACNALPREEDDNGVRARVLAEWRRVLRPDGFIFVRMHNSYGICQEIRDTFTGLGWSEVDVRQPEPAWPNGSGVFQVFGSSG
jgi:hypothetical protein